LDDAPPFSPVPLMSPTFAALATALAAAQGEIDNASKDAKNPHFGNKYADLASVWEACRGPLSKHGLCVLQPTYLDGSRVVVRTILAHKSGEWIASDLSTAPTRPGPQELGSAITYLRRYALSAMVGIAPADDDGEAAEGRQGAAKAAERPTKSREPEPRREEPSAITEKAEHDPSWKDDHKTFFAALKNLPDENGNADGFMYQEVCDYCEAKGQPRPSCLPRDRRNKLIKYLSSPEGRAEIVGFLRTRADANAAK